MKSILSIYRSKIKKYQDKIYGENIVSLMLWLVLLYFLSLTPSFFKILFLFYTPYLTVTPCLEKIRSFLEHNSQSGEKTYSWRPGFFFRFTIWPYHINYHCQHHQKPSVTWYNLPRKFSSHDFKNTSEIAKHLIKT